MASSATDVVREIYDAFARADLDAVFARCAPDVEVTQDPRLPWGGHHIGHDGLAQFAVALVGAIDSAVTVEQIFGAGDDVVQHGRTRGTVRSNGAEFDIAECHIWTIRDGLATRAQFFIDSDAMLAALQRD